MTETAHSLDVGDLPEWDLADLYAGPDDPRFAADLEAAAAGAKDLQENYRGRIGELDGARLNAAIAEYERLDEILGRLSSYAFLLYAGDMGDAEIARFFQNTRERITTITTALLFLTLEINRVDAAALEAKLKVPELARYAPWLERVRLFRPYQLDDDLEKLLLEKEVAGRGAWTRLFDETMTGLRFPVDGKDLTGEEALHLLSDADPAVREKAAHSLAEVFAANIRLFTLITNTPRQGQGDRGSLARLPLACRGAPSRQPDRAGDHRGTGDRGEGGLSGAFPSLLHAQGQVAGQDPTRDVGPQCAAARGRRAHRGVG